jgi:hypothetical protein
MSNDDDKQLALPPSALEDPLNDAFRCLADAQGLLNMAFRFKVHQTARTTLLAEKRTLQHEIAKSYGTLPPHNNPAFRAFVERADVEGVYLLSFPSEDGEHTNSALVLWFELESIPDGVFTESTDLPKYWILKEPYRTRKYLCEQGWLGDSSIDKRDPNIAQVMDL